ncbi:uncharacterized protein LOC101855007 [Aplysia californica]|uniref:Uncharacterized protein LOC101855007 n=1 Tax=Aplysia californica TaxID=6500 RepID=A0ABM0ZWK0_APLCA|nr:uncharacterized protein LOC101855007 [Aplysia californica]XP_012935992.1 uncharacterized protein LOC101855007 [Aplysia californica]
MAGAYEGEVYSHGCKLVLPDLKFKDDIQLRSDPSVTVHHEKQRLLKEHYPAGKDRPDDYKIIIYNRTTRHQMVMNDSKDIEEYCSDLADDIELHIKENNEAQNQPARGHNLQTFGVALR